MPRRAWERSFLRIGFRGGRDSCVVFSSIRLSLAEEFFAARDRPERYEDRGIFKLRARTNPSRGAGPITGSEGNKAETSTSTGAVGGGVGSRPWAVGLREPIFTLVLPHEVTPWATILGRSMLLPWRTPFPTDALFVLDRRGHRIP